MSEKPEIKIHSLKKNSLLETLVFSGYCDDNDPKPKEQADNSVSEPEENKSKELTECEKFDLTESEYQDQKNLYPLIMENYQP